VERRPLGRSGLSTAPLVLGGNVFGWTADRDTSFRVLDAFVDGGFDTIDTADVYSAWAPGNVGGESETIIGEWLRRRGGRDRVVIATKVGWDQGERGLNARHVAEAVDASLRRLGTDYVDLYQSHRDDPEVPLEETLGAFARLIEQGKVRAIGCSQISAPRLREALDVSARLGLPRYETLQPQYNLHDRAEFEAELATLCREQEMGVICFFGLAAGFLTGKYRSAADAEGKARGARVRGYLNPRGFRILEALDAVSARTGASPAQIALAWLMGRPGLTAPIASATSVEQVREIMKAAELKLGAEALAVLDEASKE